MKHNSYRVSVGRFGMVAALLGFAILPSTAQNDQGTLFASIASKKSSLKVNMAGPIKGRVTGEDGEAVPGASVRLKGTNIGSISDGNGNFSINADGVSSPVIIVSMIGYEPIEIDAKNQTSINVKLKVDNKSLQEVVVIGYGTAIKKDVTGSISSIQMGDIKNQAITSFDQALQGRAAGVTVNNNSGQPGGGVSVRVRGITSVSSTNEPLYVIDGVPQDGGNELGGGGNTFSFSILGGGGGQTKQNALSALNPNDIVSIDILKDASATAIYGSRASNGVVIVTTKRGKTGDAKISYDTYFGFQQVAKKLEVMNLQEYAAYQNQLRSELRIQPIEEFQDPSILGPGTYWQDEIFQNGSVKNHQVSFSGGKDNTNYYISANYFDQKGTVIGSGFERAAIRVNFDSQIKKWFKFGMSSNFGKTNQKITLTDSNDGVVGSALLQAPNIAARNPDGTYGAVEDINNYNPINPVAQALDRTMKRNNMKLNANTWMDFTLGGGFSFRNEVGGDFSFTDNIAFAPTFKYGRNENTISKLLRRYENNLYFSAKQLLNYNKVFNNVHKVSAMVGHEVQGNRYRALSAQASDLSSNNILSFTLADPKTNLIGDSDGPWAMESYLARANYGYGDFLNVTATYRKDGSSNFGSANRWGDFYSGALGWTLTSHKFMKGIDAINNLKVRIGYGEVGNQNIAGYAFGSALNTFPSSFGTAYVLNRLANPNVGWEASLQTNAGIDLGLFKNKITVSLDVYKKVSSDFLLTLTTPSFLGIGKNWFDVQVPYFNAGEMQNTGLDLAINTINVETKNGFKWNTSAVFSMYKNKLNALDSDNTVIDNSLSNIDFSNETVTRTVIGQPIGQFFGYKMKGIFQSLEDIRSAPIQDEKTAPGDIQFEDINGDGKIDSGDRTFIGSPHPDFTFGLTNNFNYKNLDFSVFLSGSYGAEIYNYTRSRTEGLTDVSPNQLKTAVNRWTPDNTTGGLPRFSATDPTKNRRVSSRWIEDGSFARISNVSIGYVLPSKIFNKTFIKKVRVYGSGQNLYTFTKYSGFDPEIGSYNNEAMLSNIDGGNYPTPRSVTMGFNIEF